MLRVLTLSTLFPDHARPVLGTFVERQTLGLAEHPGIELRVVVPRGLPPWPLARHVAYREIAQLPDQENWQTVPLYRPRFTHWPVVGGRFDMAGMIRALKPLLSRLRETFPFDVIDAEYFFPDGPAAVALGEYFGVPVSIKARGSDIHLWGTRADTRRQVIAAGQAADGLLAVSAALKRDMVALGVPETRIKVHYTGVDLNLFKLTDHATAKAMLGVVEPLIVSVGTLNPRKGHDLVIRGLARLPGVRLAVIGSGPNRAALEALARANHVADRIRFLGSLGRAEVALWLVAADVMALPSASEGLANAWVEALACGTPVVTCAVGGAPELIKSPTAGRLVERTPAAVAAGIQALLADPPARAAVRDCVSDFTWAANTAALFDHLSRLVAERRARG
jgi:glycosyltransferase involved in cell wall biosynthesis